MGHVKSHREGVVCGVVLGVRDGAQRCGPIHEMKEEEMWFGVVLKSLNDACLA